MAYRDKSYTPKGIEAKIICIKAIYVYLNTYEVKLISLILIYVAKAPKFFTKNCSLSRNISGAVGCKLLAA